MDRPPVTIDNDLCVLDGHFGGEFALFGIGGLLMIGFHCAGMCGPLIMAFRFGSDGPWWRRALAASGQLLSYQAGRLLVYCCAGFLIGLIGYTLHQQIRSISNILALVTAGVFLLMGLAHLGLLGSFLRASGQQPGWLAAGMRLVLDRWRGRPFARAFFLGVVMGFLPCMLVFWSLGLAASTAHPADGALLMALLVAMTTPVLLAAALAPVLVGRWHSLMRDRISPYAMIFSALWLLLIGLAANGLIPHQHMRLGQWTVMFW